jgi:hypothetical protein
MSPIVLVELSYRCAKQHPQRKGEEDPARAGHVPNGTARIARLADTETMSQTTPESLSNANSGDVLVSHPTAVREREVSVIPNAPHAISPTDDAAPGDGRSEADGRGVDACLTEDQRTL